MWRDELLRMLYRQYREDPWVQALYQVAGQALDKAQEDTKEYSDQRFFETATWLLPEYERMLGITPKPGQTMEQRRAVVAAKWKNGGKITLALLQAIADSWHKDMANVDYVDGRILVGIFDIISPTDIASLKEVIEETKPAHLPVDYETQVANQCPLAFGGYLHQSMVIYI